MRRNDQPGMAGNDIDPWSEGIKLCQNAKMHGFFSSVLVQSLVRVEKHSGPQTGPIGFALFVPPRQNR